jgi:hypothetical protein
VESLGTSEKRRVSASAAAQRAKREKPAPSESTAPAKPAKPAPSLRTGTAVSTGGRAVSPGSATSYLQEEMRVGKHGSRWPGSGL